jgi:hypothetical protein
VSCVALMVLNDMVALFIAGQEGSSEGGIGVQLLSGVAHSRGISSITLLKGVWGVVLP